MKRCYIPVKVPHHVVLEIGRDSPGKTGPWQQSVCLALLHPVCLMAGLPLQMWISQGHTDIIEETRQRTEFDNGILEKRREWLRHWNCASHQKKAYIFLPFSSHQQPVKQVLLLNCTVCCTNFGKWNLKPIARISIKYPDIDITHLNPDTADDCRC